MGQMQSRNRQASESSDALTVGNQGKAPGKSPATAKLAKSGGSSKAQNQSSGSEQQSRGDADKIGSQDIQYEILAHKIGYQDTIGSVEGELLKQWGYEPSWASRINDAATGLFVGLIKPDKAHPDLKPVLVFRGTAGFTDIISDTHPKAVGYNQFQQNSRFIKQLITEAGGSVDVTGHSLGGALAQHCGATFAGNVDRVVTFQAPGVEISKVNKFSKEEDKPSVTHHIAGGDLVDTAGYKHLEGEVFRHTPGGGPTSHIKFLLTAPEFAAQREQLGLTDEMLAKLGIDKQTNHSPVERHEEYPHAVKSAIDETVRKGAGLVLYPVLTGVSVLTRNDDKDIRKQIDEGDVSSLSGMPVSERSYMIDRLCRGMTGNADEAAILKLLRASASAGDMVRVVDVVGAHLIASNVDGAEFKELRQVFRQHYYTQCSQGQAFELLQSCINGRTSEWEEEMIADILTSRSDGRALITRVGDGNFAKGLNSIQWQLDGGDQRRVDALYAK